MQACAWGFTLTSCALLPEPGVRQTPADSFLLRLCGSAMLIHVPQQTHDSVRQMLTDWVTAHHDAVTPPSGTDQTR